MSREDEHVGPDKAVVLDDEPHPDLHTGQAHSAEHVHDGQAVAALGALHRVGEVGVAGGHEGGDTPKDHIYGTAQEESLQGHVQDLLQGVD